MSLIDLHTHTTCSDGAVTPTQLVELAAAAQLAAVAITDHDTVAGLRSAAETGERLGVEVVSGVEISATWDSGTLHMLGYLFDPECPKLASALDEQRAARDRRNPLILEKLKALGFELTADEVALRAGGEVVGRPHIAQAMVARGYCCNVKEAFDRFLSDRGPAFVEKECVSPARAIQMIHDAGGLAVIAHPKWLHCSDEDALDAAIYGLRELGVDGIECMHSDHDQADERRFEKMARRYGMLITGGTDWHGHKRGDVQLGRGRGRMRIPYELLARMKAFLGRGRRLAS